MSKDTQKAQETVKATETEITREQYKLAYEQALEQIKALKTTIVVLKSL